jgi:hypothetical protein
MLSFDDDWSLEVLGIERMVLAVVLSLARVM